MTEASDASSNAASSRKGESNDPQGAWWSKGLQKSKDVSLAKSLMRESV